MKQYIFIILLGVSLHTLANPVVKTDTLSFVFEGKKLIGLLDLPVSRKPAALVLLIPGSGKTDMEKNWYYEQLRHFFTGEGLACFVWDKPGCGKSEGVFTDSSIKSSAREAIAAIKELKRLDIPGSDKIGLWGLSRGGWVCPYIIAGYPSITFWISASGPEDKDNAQYLLEKNFLIEGRGDTQTRLLVSEWKHGNDLFRKGGSFEAYQEATRNLRADSFWLSVCGDPYTKEGYERTQKNFRKENYVFDEETGLRVYVPEFATLLGKINCPVLAVFGEKDSQVDWEKTRDLYEKTIGKNPRTSLTIKTFPDCNHNIFKCKTGGMQEDLDKIEFCEGYFETMSAWLKEAVNN